MTRSIILVIVSMLLSAAPAVIAKTNQYDIKNSVIKITTTSFEINPLEPWTQSYSTGNGSGFVIEGDMILTNAHVATYSNDIAVNKPGNDKLFNAKPLYISHAVDLAILTVEDKSFFDGIQPLPLGDLPDINDKITVYGYPSGGNSLSATRGIISRIEYTTYSHSLSNHLLCQTDAAINSGNSGGPAISNGNVAGVAVQVWQEAENMGYIIPVPVINQFLEDIKDGVYNGVPIFHFNLFETGNTMMNRYFNFNDKGVLISKVKQHSGFEALLQDHDILTGINQYSINNRGQIQIKKDLWVSWFYLIEKMQIGETADFKIFRKGSFETISAPLTKSAASKLVHLEYDNLPRYFIYGGYVFVPLTRNIYHFCRSNGIITPPSWKKAIKRYKGKQKELVILLRTLSHKINFNQKNGLETVNTVNSEPIIDFNDFVQKIETGKQPFLFINIGDNIPLIIEKKAAEEANPDILKNYRIQSDRYMGN